MSYPLSVHTQETDDTAIVAPQGEVDLATAAQLDEAIRRGADRKPLVVLDLRQVEFMDSVGVKVLLAAELRSRDDGYALTLVRGGRAVQRILELAGVDRELTFLPDPPVDEQPTG